MERPWQWEWRPSSTGTSILKIGPDLQRTDSCDRFVLEPFCELAKDLFPALVGKGLMERFGKLPQGEEGRSSIPEKVVKVTRSADLIAEALCKEERDLWWRCPEALFNPACDPDQSIPPAEGHTSMEKVGPVRLPRGGLLARP